MMEKARSFDKYCRMLWGSNRALPQIVHGADGDRQFERWDPFVREVDKQFIKSPHCETSYIFAMLVSTICHGAVTTSSHERKYLAAILMRDFLNSALKDAHDLCGLPVGDAMLLPLNGCVILEAKDFLTTLEEGDNLISWWNAVLARDIILPIDGFLSNPVPRLKSA